jgi:hypothetical protein
MTMARYEVIESKTWKSDDGRTASIYGAVPWTSSSEEKRWKIVTRGYTMRDNVNGTIGSGRQPWKTRAEAQEWVDKANKRVDELAASHGRPAHAKKKSSAQLDREIVDALNGSDDLTKQIHQTLRLYEERGEFNPRGPARLHGAPDKPLDQARDVLTRAGYSWRTVGPIARHYIRAAATDSDADAPDDDRFDREWKRLARQGKADAFGASAYRRVKEDWVSDGRPTAAIKAFIRSRS